MMLPPTPDHRWQQIVRLIRAWQARSLVSRTEIPAAVLEPWRSMRQKWRWN